MAKLFKSKHDLILGLAIFLIVAISFILGVILGSKYLNRPEIKVFGEQIDINSILTPTNDLGQGKGLFFASKSGKYYYSGNCSTNIKEANKIWFMNELQAQSSGYLKSPNC